LDLNSREVVKELRSRHSNVEDKDPKIPDIPDPDYDVENETQSFEKPRQKTRESLSPPRDYSMSSMDSVSPKEKRGKPSMLGSNEKKPLETIKNQNVGRKPRDTTGRGSSSEGRISSSSNGSRGSIPKNVWVNANRYMGSNQENDDLVPTKTLKEALKYRPSVSEFVKEITKASEKDRQRERERKQMEREEKGEGNEEREDKSEEDEAKMIYREILEVVSLNSPASIQTVKGRMVGYGEEGKKNKKALKKEKKDSKKSSHNLAKIRLSEDRESITTSLDSYPFAPTSPYHHGVPSRHNRFGYPVFPEKEFGLASPTGPVSFSGFSPSSPVGLRDLPSLSTKPGPHSLINPRKEKKKKGFWKFFF